MLNTVILAGNLGQDPESFFTPDEGTHIATFSLAFVSGFKDGNKKTGWLKCKCFGKNADLATQYLSTGSRVAVTGTLSQETWKTENNEKRSSYSLIARDIEFIKTDHGNDE